MDNNAVGFRDPSVEFSFLEKYKGHVGQKDRVAIVSQSLVRGFTHYVNQKKFICLSDGSETPRICCQTLNAPHQYFAALVWHYTTDPEANPISKEKPYLGKLKVWVLPESKYQELGSLDGQWPLTDRGWGKPQHDIIVTTTENTFQKMTFVPTPDAIWKVSGEALYKKIAEKAAQSKPQAVKALGAKLTEQEVMALLGKAPVGAAGPAFGELGAQVQSTGTDIDLSDLLK